MGIDGSELPDASTPDGPVTVHSQARSIVDELLTPQHRTAAGNDLDLTEALLETLVLELLEHEQSSQSERVPSAPKFGNKEVRIRPGVYVGLADSTMAAIKLVFAFVTLNPENWHSIVRSGMTGGIGMISLLNVFRRLKGEELQLFEAIHAESSKLKVINHDRLAHSIVTDDAYGFTGLTTEELVSALPSLSPSAIAVSLTSLQRQGVIAERQGRWYIGL